MFKKPETWKDWSLLLSAWISALIVYGKAAWGFDLTPYVDVNFIMLTLFMGWTVYGVWKNTYVSPKAKREKEILNSYKELASSSNMSVTGKINISQTNADKLAPLFTWIKYADDSFGTGMSDSAQGKKYIGIAINQLTSVESDDPHDYEWALIK